MTPPADADRYKHHRPRILPSSGDHFPHGSEDNTVRLWDVSSGEALLNRNHQDPVQGVVFNRGGAPILT